MRIDRGPRGGWTRGRRVLLAALATAILVAPHALAATTHRVEVESVRRLDIGFRVSEGADVHISVALAAGGKATARVFDPEGDLVAVREVTMPRPAEFDLTDLDAGVWNLRVKTAGQSTATFLVQFSCWPDCVVLP